MEDDSIALRVAEEIKDKINKDIEIIIGETDFEYCLERIDENDFLIILDTTLIGVNPGDISKMDLKEVYNYKDYFYSQHQLSLVELLDLYKINVKGLILGIEAYNISFSNNLSKVLKDKFNIICNEVIKEINMIIEGENYA